MHLYLFFLMKLNPKKQFKWSKTFIMEQLCCLPGNHPPSDVHSSSGKHFQLGSELCFNLQPSVRCHVSVSCRISSISLLKSHVPGEDLRRSRCLCECRLSCDVCYFFWLGWRARGKMGDNLTCSWTNIADLAQIKSADLSRKLM